MEEFPDVTQPPPWHAATDQAWRDDFFHQHTAKMCEQMKKRKADVALKCVAIATTNKLVSVGASQTDQLVDQCTRRPSDKYAGDARLRGMRALLTQIDQRGYERSPNQLAFHEAFIRACSRIFYREDWAVHRTEIMAHNNWTSAPSEVLISTPVHFPCLD